LKRLPQGEESWEANFRALPKTMVENETHDLGLVVVQNEGSVLGQEEGEHAERQRP
jgi:hypothetical protein